MSPDEVKKAVKSAQEEVAVLQRKKNQVRWENLAGKAKHQLTQEGIRKAVLAGADYLHLLFVDSRSDGDAICALLRGEGYDVTLPVLNGYSREPDTYFIALLLK